jgi:hypothetical protein
MILNRLHRLRNSDPDESGTDTLDVQEEEKDIDPEDPDGEEKQEETEQTEAAEDELIVTIGDEPQEESEESSRPWVNDLRKRDREKTKRIRELERALEDRQGGEKVDPLGEEPELKDFDYDEVEFKAAVKAWFAKKADHDKRQEQVRRQQEETAKEWQAVQETYTKGKARFPAEKMAEAEEEVSTILSGPRQAMLMDMADDSAQLVIALGTNPEVLRKLASIKSDAKFVKELAKVEMNVKVQSKKTPPPPERTISGSGRTPGASASNLEQLRARADKTGDWTEYFAEKRKAGK